MKHRALCILLGFVFFSFGMKSAKSQVEIIGDDDVQAMLRMRRAATDTIALTGYRIQLFFGNNRGDAQKKQAEFNYQYPEWSNETYLLYYDPNWRFRVGNFYHKIDAQPMMQELLRDFGNVFLIRDKIELPALREKL